VRVSARSVAGALGEIVGPGRLEDDRARTAAAAIDGRVPSWIVRPRSVEAIAGVMALAAEEGLAVVPRGSGSALELGFPPARLDIVLDLAGLDRILDDKPDDLTVTVEAGVSAGALDARLGARRQILPVDPPGWRARTLGGLAATGASGPRRQRHGTMRDLLLGVRFVQADGVVTWGGAKVVKSVSGYDVPKLHVGALGTLGVLAELTLRLHPAPETEATWLAAFPTSDAAGEFVARLVDSTIEPSRVEVLNPLALRTVGREPRGFTVAVSIGSAEAAVRAQGERMASLAEAAGASVAPADAAFWEDHARAARHGAVGLRLATLPTAIGRVLRELERLAPAAVTGTAALGTLTIALEAAESEATRAVVERLRDLVGPDGGSVVVERGPAALREAIDPWGPVEPGAFALMTSLRDAFDRARVVNPGRFVGRL
jgi:glycolate oxidase FAD binding subunit